jgi:hypothetical protein
MRGDQDEQAVLRRVSALLAKTVEKGAAPEEEKSSVQLAYQLTRLHDLDVDVFKQALARIGSPPRYLVTQDGFLMPATVARGAAPWDGTERRRRAWDGTERRSRGSARAAPGPECPASPSGKHRMTPIMQGTFRTGFEGCVHCGTRRKL